MTARLRLVAIVLATCAAGLVLLELALRRFWTPARRYYVWSPGLDTIHRADPRLTPGVDGPSHFRVSSLGVRGGEVGASEHRVLAVGGSTTECLFLDEPESWAGLLQAAGERRFGAGKAWVGNAGRSGHTSREHVLQLERLLEVEARLDRVVVLLGVNDLGRRLAHGDGYAADWEHDAALFETVEANAFDLRPMASEHDYPRALALHRVARLAKLRWQAGEVHADSVDPHVYERWRALRHGAAALRGELPDLASALDEFERNVRSMIASAGRRHVPILFLTQPALWRADLEPELCELLWMGGVGDYQRTERSDYYTVEALARGLRRYDERLMETCRSAGVECFDLAGRVPRDGVCFYDDVHFTEEGARRVAALLEELVWR